MINRWRPLSTLLRRECYRFLRLYRQTIFPPVIMTLLFIFIFGFSLGPHIQEVAGYSYIIYILPGLAAMGSVNNSYANSSTSLFMSRMDYSIDNMVTSPLSSYQVVSSLVVGGLLRGMVVGLLTLLVSMPLIHLHVLDWSMTLLVLALTSIFFSCVGIVAALFCDGWDTIASFGNFVVMPFVYLGGVFYSIKMLPPFWRKVSLFNPIFYLVDALRHAVLGVSDLTWIHSLSIISSFTLVSFLLCVYLFRIGYKLVK